MWMSYWSTSTPTPPELTGEDQLRETKLFIIPMLEARETGTDGTVAASMFAVAEYGDHP